MRFAKSLTSQMRRPFEVYLSIPFLLVIAAFYWWTSTSSPDPLASPNENSTSGTGHFYHLLTNGFLSGHLYLPVAPVPALLTLRNPYDPKLNAGLRLHDASLYRGKYYLYFGAAPVVTLFLPWKLITGSAIPQNEASAIFLTVGFVFSCLLFVTWLQLAPAFLRFLAPVCLLALGLAQTAP
jgi:hypothetical protein